MEVRRHRSAVEFVAIAEPLYRRDPIANTIELTFLCAGAVPADTLLASVWDEDGTVVGATLQTPGYPLACNGIPAPALPAVVDRLTQWRPALTGVRGTRSNAHAFADAWHAATGRTATVSMEERLYRLATLRAPVDVAGVARQACGDDRELLAKWAELFMAETFGDTSSGNGPGFVDSAFRLGNRFVLWHVDDEPVSMAMLRAPAAGVSRIGPVFTPTNRRGHGYGSAVTAAASSLAHRSGTPDVVLFADLANPTSTSIYQKIGFQVVADSVRIDFGTLG